MNYKKISPGRYEMFMSGKRYTFNISQGAWGILDGKRVEGQFKAYLYVPWQVCLYGVPTKAEAVQLAQRKIMEFHLGSSDTLFYPCEVP